MSGSEKRKQWANHMKDEAKALELQQQAAGDSHAPVEGPRPYSADELGAAVTAAVAAAVAAERQRCADIADSWRAETRLMRAFGDFTERELRAAALAVRAVGSEIRGLTEEELARPRAG